MGAQGTSVLDFGAFPGKSDASVDVAAAAIAGGSLVEAWIFPSATADHTADEHMVESLKVFAGNVQAGVGFTIYGFNTSELFEKVDQLARYTSAGAGGLRDRLGGGPEVLGRQASINNEEDRHNKGTLIYGQFTVAWVWN